MRLPIRVALLALLLPCGGTKAAEMAALLRSGQFTQAEAAASGYADPLAQKLVLYQRLLTPGAATSEEISAFLAQNPDWPARALLARRRDEALAHEPDDAAARTACAKEPPSLPGALARCARAMAAAGDQEQATEDARRAWSGGFAGPDEGAFLARWKSALRPEDEAARFEHLLAADSPEAAAQIARLPAADRAEAKARLALRHGAPDGWEQYEKLPAAAQDRPHLVLDAARWLRRAKRMGDALAFWRARAAAAEETAPEAMRAAFWAERNALSRDLLAEGDNADAAWLADDALQAHGDPALSSAFLAGFIELRRLDAPLPAAEHFTRLAALSPSAITQARAHYWLARALAAAGRPAADEYRKAAAYPLTFYGQLAAQALGDDRTLRARIRAASDPAAPVEVAWDFAGSELVRAAAILAAWGEFGRARAFLIRAQQVVADPRQQALCARLSLALGMPDAAVAIARRMGAVGLALPQAGWPEPVVPPAGPPDPAVILALIRQESSFDAGIVSPAGARGLMQLMPATAQAEARRTGGSVSDSALTADPGRNMELGASYVRQMLARFGSSLPLAVAAYNAGPHRVEQWLREYGDPRGGQIDMIDWIELIPFEETRNYVERVLENVVVYQARRDEPASALNSQWMR